MNLKTHLSCSLILLSIFQLGWAGKHISDNDLWSHVVTIDRLAWQEREDIKKVNKQVDDQDFVRRIYLDITGKIPTYEQTTSFLKSKNIQKRSLLIEELLDTPGYVSHYSNFWLDLLRAPYQNSEDDFHKEFNRYIEKSLAENKSYDAIVKELMTAEGKVQENQAIGFYMRDRETGTMDTLNATVRAFLGTRLGCAQCHNHRFDKWTQREFYESAAFFHGVSYKRTYGNDDLRIIRTHLDALLKNDPLAASLSPYAKVLFLPSRSQVNYDPNKKLTYPEIYRYDDAKPNEIVKEKIVFGYGDEKVEGKDRREVFANWMTSKNNPMFARIMANRLWKRIMGVALLDPLDDWKDNIVIQNPYLFEALGDIFSKLNYNFKSFLSVIFNSEAYQLGIDLKNEFKEEDYKLQGSLFKRMSAAQLNDSLLTLQYGNLDRFSKLDPQYFEYEDKLNLLTLEYQVKIIPLTTSFIVKNTVNSKEIDPKILEIMSSYAEKIKALEDYYHIDKNGYINKSGMSIVKNNNSKNDKSSDMMNTDSMMAENYSGKAVLRSNYHGSDFMDVFGSTDRSAPDTNVEMRATMKQILKLINSPECLNVVRNDSYLMQECSKLDKLTDKVSYLYYAIYGRAPTKKDFNIAVNFFEVSNKQSDWEKYVIALINSPEFYFIK